MLASLSESFISCEIHLNKMLNLQNVSEERKMPNIHGWICAVVSRFRFHIPHQLSNKTRSSMFTTNLGANLEDKFLFYVFAAFSVT